MDGKHKFDSTANDLTPSDHGNPHVFSKELFISPLPTDLLCTACCNGLAMAMRLTCGCRYCFVCIHAIFRKKITCVCLGCSMRLGKSILPDYHARRKIQKQVIRCTNYKKGCTAQLTIKHLVQHLLKDCIVNASAFSPYETEESDRLQEQTISSRPTCWIGILEWKVEKISEARVMACIEKGAGYLDSPPFYSTEGGYLMGARLYLNGDGMGWNSHLSLFIYIMRGNNDDNLKWPFDLHTTFEILDQETQQENITDGFPASPTSNSFYKPKKDRPTNIPTGCPLFATKQILDNPRYVKNNTMMIRVTVK